jgi:hypothetical protein
MANLTFSDAFAELNALFNATFAGVWNTVAQNAASPATNLYLSLHNAAPGNGGSQSTNETAYTNYVRLAVARSSAGWTVTQGSGTTFSNAVNAAIATFATCGTTGDTLTHWGLGLASSGAGTLLAWGPLGPTAGPDVPFTCTSASPGVLTAYGYTPTVNDRVMVQQLPGSEGLPTGLTEGTLYFVGTAPGGQTLTLSTTTANGAPVNTSSTGSGLITKGNVPLAVATGIAPSFAAGAFSIQKA